MPDLTRGITTRNILAYARRYVSLLLIMKILILKFDSDFISTTLEAQPECDCKVPVSSKQEGLHIFTRYSGIRLERVGQLTKTQRKNGR